MAPARSQQTPYLHAHSLPVAELGRRVPRGELELRLVLALLVSADGRHCFLEALLDRRDSLAARLAPGQGVGSSPCTNE